MRVNIHHQPVELQDRDLLGVGGEARVYRWQNRAVKVYHPVDPTLSASERQAAEARAALRLDKIQSFPRALPRQVVGPLETVLDAASSQPVGFTMELVPRGQEARRLSVRSWREGAVSNDEVTSLFQKLREVLSALHLQGVVVGDLNDGNVLFTDTTPYVIDADSMQFGRFPCVVAHEHFLDPHLFGVDFLAGPAFSPDSDWYAFAVMLFASLLYVHPYGGVHPHYPTLLRRAEAGHSLLRGDVKVPKVAVPWQVLSDELLAQLDKVFEKGSRGPFPAAALQLSWQRCKTCGVWHARSSCPLCVTVLSAQVATPTVSALRHHGKCQSRMAFSTTGRILAVRVEGGLRYLYEEDGVVRREDGTEVMAASLEPDLRFALAGRATWVGRQDRLLKLEGGKITARAATAPFGLEPAFDASEAGCFRLEGDYLVESERGVRWGQVLSGQTWLRVGEALGFGFYRAGLITVYFLFHTDRPGLRQVNLPGLDGKLIEADAAFDDRHVLFQVTTERNGRRTSSLYVLNAEGKLLGSLRGDPTQVRALSALSGRAILGDRVLMATDAGLLSLAVDRASGTLVEGNVFVDSEPFVRSGATVFPGPGGSVYVVTTRDISHLTLVR